MRITDTRTRLLHVPVERALVNKTKSQAFMEVVTLELQTDEGLTGYGYSYTDGFGGHAIKALLDTDVRTLLLGKDPLQVKTISEFLLWELRQAGFAGVTVLGVAAVDLALWDILSKALARPVCDIIGKLRDRVPMYASVAGWNGLPAEEMVARAKQLVEDHGMHGVKIQVGRGTLAYDAARLEKLRLALGSETKLFVDANTVLDVPGAIRLARRIREYDVFWFEEPIPLTDLEGHRMVAEQGGIPLATGENFFSIHDADPFIRERLVTYIQADVIRVGGITEWLRAAAFCDAQGIKISPHFVMEVTAQVQCCVPNALFVEYIPWFQELLAEPASTEGGYALARAIPGLGLKFTDEAVERYHVN